MNDDPFAAFKDAAGQPIAEAKPEKKRRGRKKKHAMEQAMEGTRTVVRAAMTPKAPPDDLKVLIEVIKILTPFTHKDQERIMNAVVALLGRP